MLRPEPRRRSSAWRPGAPRRLDPNGRASCQRQKVKRKLHIPFAKRKEPRFTCLSSRCVQPISQNGNPRRVVSEKADDPPRRHNLRPAFRLDSLDCPVIPIGIDVLEARGPDSILEPTKRDMP